MTHQWKRRLTLLSSLCALVFAIPVASAAAADAGTESPTGPGAHEVTITGAVYSLHKTYYAFQYGTTTAYGSETPTTLDDDGQSITAVQATITGLSTSTTYHYRLAVLNSDGTVSYGEDRTFTTYWAPQFVAFSGVAISLTGTAPNGWSLRLPNGSEVSCGATGSMSGPLTTSLSLTPEKCAAFSFSPSTVSMNGCAYVIPASGGFSINCPSGKEIEISGGSCAIKIPGQTPAGAVVSSNLAGSNPGSVRLAFNSSGLKYTKTKDGFLCNLDGTGSGESATLTGNLDISAAEAGTPVRFWIAK